MSGERVGMFERLSAAKLAAMAAGAGFIAVATITVEILSGGLPARFLGFHGGFVSLPMGAAAPILAALTSRQRLGFAAPALALSALYWLLFALYF